MGVWVPPSALRGAHPQDSGISLGQMCPLSVPWGSVLGYSCQLPEFYLIFVPHYYFALNVCA